MDRRDFLRTLGVGMVASALPTFIYAETVGRSVASDCALRLAGRTVSWLGLDSFPLRLYDTDYAADIVNRCLEAGVGYIDTAPSYGDAEDKIGRALQGQREHCWLATETHLHDATGSLRLLETSLRRLRADHVEEWRMPSVTTSHDLDRLLADHGALTAAEQAKAEGLVMHIGVSGDSSEVLVQALQRYRFDTVRLVVNCVDQFDLSILARELAPLAKERGVVVAAVKLRAEVFLGSGDDAALSWALSQSGSCAVLDLDTPEKIERAMEVADCLRTMTSRKGA